MGKAGFFLLVLGLSLTLRAGLPEGYDVILVDRTASPEIFETADALADLLFRTWGRRPAVRKEAMLFSVTGIHVGREPPNDSSKKADPTDTIRIARTANGLEIRGHDDTSTCFAIYRFAEEFLGWRFYQPGKLGYERIDAPPDPPRIDGKPTVLLEESAGYFSRNLHGLGENLDALKWRKWNRLRERFSFNHTLQNIVTPGLFEEHPDWFARDGSGKPKKPPYPVVNSNNDHPDLSNPDLQEFVADAYAKALKDPNNTGTIRVIRSPGTVSASLSLADSFFFGSFGQDYPWLPKGYFRRWPDWSNHVFTYTNAVARLLEKSLPTPANKLYLGALAYLSWENVPDFPLHPSIIPYLTFDRSQWYDVRAKADDLGNVSRWARSGAPFLGTWDYLFTDGFLIPRSLCTVVRDSIPALYERDVRAYFSQTGTAWAYSGHTNWLAAQLLWNPQADPDKLLNEYFHEYFGPAAPEMRAFFNKAESLWMSQPDRGWWLRYWKDAWQAALWNNQELQELDDLLETALRKSRTRIPNFTSGLSPTRFYSRVRQTADLFALTKLFYRYQSSLWDLQSVDWERAPDDILDSGMREISRIGELKRLLKDKLAALQPGTDSAWIFQYDSLDATSAAISMARSGHLRQILYDTDLSEINNPKIWQQYFLDSQDLSNGVLPEGKGFFVENSRRGHIYQLFRAAPGETFLATADIFSTQSPSAMVYVRMDFFDAQRNLVGSSSRGRMSPVGDFCKAQHLRAYGEAPEGTVRGRLLIRFFEMDKYTRAEVYNAMVFKITPPDHP